MGGRHGRSGGPSALARRVRNRAGRRARCLAAAGGALALTAFPAKAQQLIVPSATIVGPPWNAQKIFQPVPLPDLGDPAARDPVAPEDMPVKGRVYPEYRAVGVRAGAFMIYPVATVGGFYDSNVFSSPTNRQDDFAARFGASVRAHSLWDRHSLDLQLSAQSLAYRDHSSLNRTDVDFRGMGRLDIDSTMQLLASLQAGYLHDDVGSLSSPTGAIEPTPYGFGSGDLTLRKELGRITASFGGRADTYDYGSVRAQNGSIINQDARDGQIYKAHGRVDYALSGKTSVFASVETNWRDLRGTPTQSLDSSGYRALAGVDVELTRLIRGEFAAGYLNQKFDSPLIGEISGPAYRAFLAWSPTRRLDIHFNAEQIVTETSETSTTGVLANAFQLGADYEIRPNLVLSPSLVYERDRFKGQTRDDDVYGAEMRLKHNINNMLSSSLWYRFFRRESNVPAANYDKHLIGINASVQF